MVSELNSLVHGSGVVETQDEFKHLNFKWSKYKAAWYYHSAEDGYWKKSKKNYSLDEVRNMFDSITFTDKQLDDSKLLHV